MMRFDTYNSCSSLSGLIPREGYTTPHHNQVPTFGGHSSASSSRHSFVKDSLRQAIQSRRALSHNPIIGPEDLFPRDVKYKLTPEEEEKRRIRREKNKVAASKCRNKKREAVNSTKMEYEKAVASNNHLEREIKRLENERKYLQNTLRSHSCSYGNKNHCRNDQNRRQGFNGNSKLKVEDDVSLRFNLKF